jgi:hypothetical protein
MEGQETLDRAFGVTPEERAVLRQSKIPRPLLERLRRTSGAPRGNWIGFLILMCLPAGVWLGLTTQPSPADRAFLFLLVPMLAALVVQHRKWRRGRAAVAATAPVRILEGDVETVRSWWFGYGECYYLWAALKFVGRAEDPIQVFTVLGSRTITGWARVYLIRVDDRERAVAIELGAETAFVEREPGRRPPEEPLRVDVAAD